MLGFAEDTSLGVEINEQRMLLVEMRKQGNKVHLQKVVQTAIPSEVIVDGKVKQVDTLAGLLRDTMRAHHIRCKKTHLVVPSQFVLIRQLQLPDLPKKQLCKVIDFELQNSIHLPFEDPVYDFVKLGPAHHHEVAATIEEGFSQPHPEAEVTLIASSRSAVDPVVAAATKAGLKPVSVDIRALALARAYHKFGADVGQKTTMFVDVGESSTDLHIFSGRTLKFTRNIPMLLESYKVNRQLDKPMQALEMVTYFQENTNYGSFTQDLAYEIERSVNFFTYTLNNREEAISRIVLSGLLPESGVFAHYLQERLPEMVVEVMPFQQLNLSASLQAEPVNLYEYAIPIGLALKEVK